MAFKDNIKNTNNNELSYTIQNISDAIYILKDMKAYIVEDLNDDVFNVKLKYYLYMHACKYPSATVFIDRLMVKLAPFTVKMKLLHSGEFDWWKYNKVTMEKKIKFVDKLINYIKTNYYER